MTLAETETNGTQIPVESTEKIAEKVEKLNGMY